VLAAVLTFTARVARREPSDRDDRERPRRKTSLTRTSGRALPGLVEEGRQGVTVLGAEDQVHPGDRRDRGRVGLGVASGDDDHRLGVPRDGAADRLAME
jgi:hypothetical protein